VRERDSLSDRELDPAVSERWCSIDAFARQGRMQFMSVHTLPTATRLGIIVAVSAGVSFAAADARAGDVLDGSGGTTTANTSVGAAALRYEHRDGLPTSIATGFSGSSLVSINVVLKVDPVTDGGPLFIVDMPRGALVQASWGTDKRIVLRPLTSASFDGQVSVRHTLTPSVDLKFGFGTISLDATKLLNKLDGASFAYDSRAQQSFLPWGFTPVETRLDSPDLDNAQLFSLPFEKFGELPGDIKGSFGVRVTTKPTFAYRTTKIAMSGASGEIANSSGELSIPAVDGDYMEVMATVDGEMNVSGSMRVAPFIRIQPLDFLPAFDIGVDVYEKDYTTAPTPVPFRATPIHIPMPNVHVPSRGVDVGTVKIGSQASRSVEIQNSGEKEATMTFKSSSPQFQVTGERITIAPRSKYDLSVRFSPSDPSGASADITVLSTDADSPEQTFKVGANGADVGAAGDDGDRDPSTTKGEDGCGCKAAGTSRLPSWAGFGLLGLGALVLARRRRNAA
jgi:MYXO-CTERM domain-containing protein